MAEKKNLQVDISIAPEAKELLTRTNDRVVLLEEAIDFLTTEIKALRSDMARAFEGGLLEISRATKGRSPGGNRGS